jgi:thiosulfate dehydrogenase [quinone] large subunit
MLNFVLRRFLMSMVIWERDRSVSHIPTPSMLRFLFTDTRMAWLWLFVRLYVGYQWITAGFAKLTGYSIAFAAFGKPVQGGSWVFGVHHGVALRGFLLGAISKSSGSFPVVQGWYATFLQHMILPAAVPFSTLVACGEFCVGLGLIVGALTGIAAFFGIVMNVNYILAGAISVNPILAVLALLLLLAWRTAGYIGIDHFLLRLRLGTSPSATGATISKDNVIITDYVISDVNVISKDNTTSEDDDQPMPAEAVASSSAIGR